MRNRKKQAGEFPGMKNTILKLGLEVNELDFDETLQELDNVDLQQAGTDPGVYGQIKSEIQWDLMRQQKRASWKTVERKYFKPEQETNLMTWAAKDQLRYLHKEYPKEWPVERLAEAFPISIDGVKRLLKSEWAPRSEVELRAHDTKVSRRWKALRTGKGLKQLGISQRTLQLIDEGKIQIGNGEAIKTLPIGKVDMMLFQRMDTKTIQPVSGPFTKMIKEYIEAKKSALTSGTDENKATVRMLSKSNPAKVSAETRRQDPQEQSYSRVAFNKTEVKLAEVKEELEDQANTITTGDEDLDSLYQEWVRGQKRLKQAVRQIPHKEKSLQEENAKAARVTTRGKYKEHFPMQYDDHQQESFVYSSNSGYVNPLGKKPSYPDKIEVPRQSQKTAGSEDGITYRRGNVFYDENGDFLYKVPGS
ncbi:PREDICTED: uncharacterized protein LOC106817510 isoform X2 [Priapulus caudatus]|uniref:Uncharacterized protein LOC106817510 isoform X2 n=1 Tax=Priapulus caudatus TaxID=37621 RepID=A0ABM1EZP3_PRICU|nr:PREDICTED: uncharacterized protein LOC106817510 isoform X2 [Priapulus caudatus]